MFITAQMIFHLLSRNYPMVRWEYAAENLEVRTAKLYRGQRLEEGNLYLLDELTDFNAIGQARGCAFLILTAAPHMLPGLFSGSDVAFVTGQVNKLDLFGINS